MIDYAAAVSGGLRLVPDGPASEALAEDYGRMVEDGLLLDDAEPFEDLMGRCQSIATRANAASSAGDGAFGGRFPVSFLLLAHVTRAEDRRCSDPANGKPRLPDHRR